MSLKKFKTEAGVQDGYLSGGNTACSTGINTNATTMIVGCNGETNCLTDGLTPDFRAYGSFPTKWLKDKQVLDVTFYFYLASIAKSKIWVGWDVTLTPLLEIIMREDFIGDALTTGKWAIGATDYTMDITTMTAATWYSQVIDSANYWTDKDTDFCLRPNADWNTDMNNTGKKYQINITTKEGGANQPYLLVRYREENLIKIARLRMKTRIKR